MVTFLMQDDFATRITMADLMAHSWWTSGPEKEATTEEFQNHYKNVLAKCMT